MAWPGRWTIRGACRAISFLCGQGAHIVFIAFEQAHHVLALFGASLSVQSGKGLAGIGRHLFMVLPVGRVGRLDIALRQVGQRALCGRGIGASQAFQGLQNRLLACLHLLEIALFVKAGLGHGIFEGTGLLRA